jgi:hypothetical protein
MPARAASVIDCIASGRPSSLISPASGGSAPAMIFSSVDLPAPLAPTRPLTLPSTTSKSTPCKAGTAPKRLLTPLAE